MRIWPTVCTADDKFSQGDMLCVAHGDSSVYATVVFHTGKPVSLVITGSYNTCFLSLNNVVRPDQILLFGGNGKELGHLLKCLTTPYKSCHFFDWGMAVYSCLRRVELKCK